MLVRDLMTRSVITVQPDTPIEQVIRLLAGQAISGLPVMDGDTLVGIISEGDLVMREKPVTAPAAVSFLGALLMVKNFDSTYEDLRRHFGTAAKDAMSASVITIAPDATVEEAARLMIERDVKRLPVLEAGRLVGILTRKDLVRALLA